MKSNCLFVVLLFPYLLFGQAIVLEKSVSDSNFPEIYWRTNGLTDSTDFKVFRAAIGENTFSEIYTIHFEKPVINDTTEFVIVDTTLAAKGLYLYYIEVLRNNQTVNSEIAYGHNFGILPNPQLTSFKATSLDDRKAVRLDWTFNYDETINSLSLYRSYNYDTGYVKVADLDPDKTFYEDVIPIANEPWFYYLVIHDYFGNQLPGVRIPAFATFAEKPFRPYNIHGEFRNDSVIIDWANPAKNSIGYRVYRSCNNKQFRLVREMTQSLSDQETFIDKSAEVISSTHLKYFVRNVSDGFLESTSSDTLEFYIPEHEKVLPPGQLDFVLEQNGNIKLLWTTPKEGFVTGYNIYLTTSDGKTQKLNKQKLVENNYIDSVFRTGGTYRYSVETIGFANKVSERKISTSVNNYTQNLHVIIDLKKQNEGLEISWKKPLNKHIVKILLYKKESNNEAVLFKTFTRNEDVVLVDSKVSSGTMYLYSLVAQMSDSSQVVLNEGVEIYW